MRFARAANDATTACIGAHAGADGGLVIAGTGSAAIARVAGAETIVGGRGFALGDGGSGAHIGLDALRAATLAFDGLGPRTELTDEILSEFDGDVVRMVRWARSARPGDYGAFAPRVFRLRRKGRSRRARHRRLGRARDRRADPQGRRARRRRGSRWSAASGRLCARTSIREIAALLKRPLYDATDGAILMAGGAVATGRGSRAMKVFYGARLFDGERFLDDHALVVEGGSIRALVDLEDRPRGGEADRSRRRRARPRLHRLADQRRRRRAVQRRADGRGDRQDRPRPPARGRDRLSADRRHRRARTCWRRR